jgi:hypothetical protein
MDQNNYSFNNQNMSNHPFNSQSSSNFPVNNQHPNQPQPQNPSNYGFAPMFGMPSTVPNYPPQYGSMMHYGHRSSQTTHYPCFPNQNTNVQITEIPEFSTQMSLGNASGANVDTEENVEEIRRSRKKNVKWTTEQNLVLLSGWIKFGTDSVIGRNQKGDTFWGKIAEYCNTHCSFESPRDYVACKNHYNYINTKLGRWRGAYDAAKRMKQSGWSEDDVLEKAHVVYGDNGNGSFNLMQEWLKVRDQPRYMSQVGGNTGSDSSGSKRAREGDGADSNSIGSIARPIGRDATKKKGKGSRKGKAEELNLVEEHLDDYKHFKEQEFERLDKIVLAQQEVAKAHNEATRAQEEASRIKLESVRTKKMKLFAKLSAKEHLDDYNKQLLEMLKVELFGNL